MCSAIQATKLVEELFERESDMYRLVKVLFENEVLVCHA